MLRICETPHQDGQMTQHHGLPTLHEAAKCPLPEGDLEPWIRCCTSRFLPLARRVAREDTLAQDALQESWIGTTAVES